jgi:hypothetical protein
MDEREKNCFGRHGDLLFIFCDCYQEAVLRRMLSDETLPWIACASEFQGQREKNEKGRDGND